MLLRGVVTGLGVIPSFGVPACENGVPLFRFIVTEVGVRAAPKSEVLPPDGYHEGAPEALRGLPRGLRPVTTCIIIAIVHKCKERTTIKHAGVPCRNLSSADVCYVILVLENLDRCFLHS